MESKNTTACQDVYAVLFSRIIAGEICAGTRLTEVALAEEFGVSRTPVREALRQLAQDGLVAIAPGEGARIIPFTADDIEDVYDIRLALELAAINIVGPSLRLQRLTEIRRLIDELDAAPDSPEYAETDRLLHDYIIESTRRRYLIAMHHQMGRLMQRFRTLGFGDPEVVERAQREHREFIAAMLVRDLDRAREVMSRHIENSKLQALSQLSRR